MNHRRIPGILMACLAGALTLVGCSSVDPYYHSEDEITLEAMQERMNIANLLEEKGRVGILAEDVSVDAAAGSRVITTAYEKDGEIFRFSQNTVFSDGTYLDVYGTTDPEDSYVYIAGPGTPQQTELSEEQAQKLFTGPLYSFSEDYQLTEVTKQDGNFVAHVEFVDEENSEEKPPTTYDITIDPVSGCFLRMEATVNGEGEGYPWTRVSTYDYSGDTTVNDAARQTFLGIGEKAEKSEMRIAFDTEDIHGEAVTDEILSSAKVVLVNFWEPWCGPCVQEMPDLQKLYEKYKDQGLLVIGFYATTGQDEDALAIVEDAGITYPILKKGSNLYGFQPEYVPTTYFADSEGNLLSEEPTIGAHSYDDWETMILEYLK